MKEPYRPRILSLFIKKSLTNGGEMSKQYFRLIEIDGYETSISVRKYVLVKDRFEIYEKFGFKNLKSFKKYRLYRQIFSIKQNTLNDVNEWIESVKKPV